MSRQTRRDFLEQSLFAAAAASLAGVSSAVRADDSPKKKKGPNERLRVACVGVGGRGSEHIREFGSAPTANWSRSSTWMKPTETNASKRSRGG